jgi:hypothetical protein
MYIQVDAVLGPAATYFVDCMDDRSAEALAANSCVSTTCITDWQPFNTSAAASVKFSLPWQYQGLFRRSKGTASLLQMRWPRCLPGRDACELMIIMFGQRMTVASSFLLVTIRYGDRLRAVIDAGYSPSLKA